MTFPTLLDSPRDSAFTRESSAADARSARGQPHRPGREPGGVLHQTSDSLRSLYARAYGSVLFPAWRGIVQRQPVMEQGRQLAQTQWMSRDERDQIQLSHLRALLTHAGRSVPYWRDLFRKIGFDPRQVVDVADLAALPLLTREIVEERRDDLVDPAQRGKTIVDAASGRAPLFERCNQSEAWRQAVRLRSYGWAGYRIGMPVVHYLGEGVGAPDGLAGSKIRVDRALRREVFVDAVQQDRVSMRATAELLARLRPHAIVAYTQALASFARWVNEHGRRDWPDVRVVCCAEGLLPGDRDGIERAFGPAIFETYGSRETMLIAAECEAHSGMHLAEENLVVEVSSRDGRPEGPGVAGDVVVTDLHNTAMPLIRYATGDLAATSDDGVCPCGRTLRRLARVEGRRRDILRDANGEPVPGTVFAAHLPLDAGSLRAFQVVQKVDGDVELRVVRGRYFHEGRFTGASRRLRGYFKGLPFRVTYCDQIPPSRSGKRRPILVEKA